MKRSLVKSRKQHASGHTLLELVVASAAAAMLMGGLASSLFIASQSLEVVVDESDSQAEERMAHQALDMINRDLQSAIVLDAISDQSVTMQVPDRNGDGTPETIQYSWSGTVGDPLTQTYNSGTPLPIATNVQEFSLVNLTRDVTSN